MDATGMVFLVLLLLSEPATVNLLPDDKEDIEKEEEAKSAYSTMRTTFSSTVALGDILTMHSPLESTRPQSTRIPSPSTTFTSFTSTRALQETANPLNTSAVAMTTKSTSSIFTNSYTTKVPLSPSKTTKVALLENESISERKLHTQLNYSTTTMLSSSNRTKGAFVTVLPHHVEHHLPPSFVHENPKHDLNHGPIKKISPDEKAKRPPGPYFRPPSAMSKNYRGLDPSASPHFNPDCWPRCHNWTTHSSSNVNKRTRKHSSNKDSKKFYNYKLLYDSIKGDIKRQETEFYAWIFGATMLTLGCLTTLSSCFVFCFCGQKWKKKRRKKSRKVDDQCGEYQRVDSVSSMVSSHVDPHDLRERDMEGDHLDSVTII